jgi:hypothetical protein
VKPFHVSRIGLAVLDFPDRGSPALEAAVFGTKVSILPARLDDDTIAAISKAMELLTGG